VISEKWYSMPLSCPDWLEAQGLSTVAYYVMLFSHLLLDRSLTSTYILSVATSGMKIAARWRVQRRWHIPLETDTSTFVMRIGNRNGRNQGLCVWVFRVEEQFICFGDFNDFTQIHHRHTVADMPDRRKVMGNKQIGQAKFPLQINEQV